MSRILALGVVVALGMALPAWTPPTGAAAIAEDGDKEAAFQKAKDLVEAGEWKKAARAFKSYRKKYARSDEEVKELDVLVLQAEVERDFAVVDKKYRKDSKVRPAIKGLRKLLGKYPEEDELRDRLLEFREGVRSQFVGIVEDFEDEDWPDVDNRRVKAVDDAKWVKHGKRAIRWTTTRAGDSIYMKPETTDWKPYTYFCFWIYNHKKSDKPSWFWIRAGSEGWSHHFEYLFKIDFTGWREVRIAFTGKRGFSRYGMPEWDQIEELEFWHSGDSITSFDVTIDDVRLEKHKK